MRRFVAAAVLVLASSCAVAAPSVEGHWRLVSVMEDGAVEHIPAIARDRSSVNLALVDGGFRAGLQCNVATGRYEYDAEERTLDGSGFTVTLMGCLHPDPYESAIIRMLSSGPIAVTLLGDTMLWTNEGWALRFVRTSEA